MVTAIQIKKETIMNKLLKKIIWPILLTPGIYLAIVWNRLPDKIAMHYNFRGQPDKYGGKTDLALVTALFTVIALIIFLLIPRIYKIDAKKRAVENKDNLLRLAFAIAVFMSFVSFIVIQGSLQGNSAFNVRLIFSGVGILFCIIGNYMHTLRPNYFAGLRLPWTLENEENWRKTHLFAGKLWFAGGLVIAVLCLFVPNTASIFVFAAVTMTLIIIPCVYSYRLYKKQKAINSTQ